MHHLICILDLFQKSKNDQVQVLILLDSIASEIN